jgi:hypothetical protein
MAYRKETYKLPVKKYSKEEPVAENKNPWVYLLLMLIPLGIGVGCICLCSLTGKIMLFGMIAFIMILPAMICIIEFFEALKSRRRNKKRE